ncbi:hypothetical protein ACFL3G_13170 [Planctomycetota bacterium]
MRKKVILLVAVTLFCTYILCVCPCAFAEPTEDATERDPQWKERAIQDDRVELKDPKEMAEDFMALQRGENPYEDDEMDEDEFSEFLAKITSPDFETTVSLTYAGSNMWHGFDWFANDHSVIQPGIDINLLGTGFGLNILWSGANGSGLENRQWLTYNPYYHNSLWDGECYQTDYKFGWRYYDGPNGGIDEDFGQSRDSDFQEFHGQCSWPSIAPEGVVPFYECSRIWPDKGGRTRAGDQKSFWRTYGGWFHTIGAYKDWDLSGWRTGADTGSGFRTIRTSFEMVYNDGAGPTPDSDRDSADHDWSHAVFSIEGKFVYNVITVTPGIHYQSSWDDSVNSSDELWFTLTAKYTF